MPGSSRPSAAEYPALASFLDTYFAEGWATKHATAADVAREYTTIAGFGRRADVDGDLRAVRRILAVTGGEDGSWRDTLPMIGGAWRPTSLAEVDGVLAILEASLD